jgi:hypothetical protein
MLFVLSILCRQDPQGSSNADYTDSSGNAYWIGKSDGNIAIHGRLRSLSRRFST